MAGNDILRKVVTITANNTVGYGTTGKAILGVVEAIEEKGTGVNALGYEGTRQAFTMELDAATKTVLGITGDYVVTVKSFSTFEGIGVSGATAPVAGDYLACDGSGNATKSATATNVLAFAVSGSTATIMVM